MVAKRTKVSLDEQVRADINVPSNFTLISLFFLGTVFFNISKFLYYSTDPTFFEKMSVVVLGGISVFSYFWLFIIFLMYYLYIFAKGIKRYKKSSVVVFLILVFLLILSLTYSFAGGFANVVGLVGTLFVTIVGTFAGTFAYKKLQEIWSLAKK